MFNYNSDSSDTIDNRETEATRIMPDAVPHPPGNDGRDRQPGPLFDFDTGGRSRRDGRRPVGPPPSTVPARSKSPGVFAVDPGAISGCLYNYTYIWLRNGRSFWFYPTYIGRKSISGYRWSRYGWSYVGLDLDLIDFFTCAGY